MKPEDIKVGETYYVRVKADRYEVDGAYFQLIDENGHGDKGYRFYSCCYYAFSPIPTPKYDPCRNLKVGDVVRVLKINGNLPKCKWAGNKEVTMIDILIVEDNKQIATVLRDFLINENYTVSIATTGEEALDMYEEYSPRLIVLDIMLPEIDGFAVCQKIRAESNTPILIVSAKNTKTDKLNGLNLGADDYITKPFDLDELVFKINAIARRLNIGLKSKVSIGNFMMDSVEHVALLNDEEINLSVREFDILFSMLSNPKKTYTRSKLMTEFWDYDSSATSRTVDVYMAKLRDKTKDCDGFEIQTVHGLGYKVILK